MACAASPLDVPLHPDLSILLNAVEGFFAKLTRQRLKRGVFRSVIDLQVAINRFVAETNLDPKPFVWTADPKRVLAAVKRGKQTLESSPLVIIMRENIVGDQFPDTPAAEKEAAQKKYADAYKHFLDVTKKRRRELLDKLESGEEISLVTPECPRFAVASPGPFFKVSGELGGGWARNGVEDVGVFNGSGFVGGLSAELDFAFNSGTYLGFGVSVLGSGI